MKLNDTLLALPPQPVTTDVLLEKYAKDGERTVEAVRQRIARALAAVEKDPARWEPVFLEALEHGFIPGGRVNSAAGTPLAATLINCFVQPVGDSVSETVDGRPGIYVALQEAALNSADDTLRWDGVDRGNQHWNQDHSMRTAFPVSCVWFYQELARKTGVDKMSEWIKKTGYGNGETGAEVDRFWLDGPLEISAMGQVGFIEKLVTNSLPFHENVQKTVKEIMLTDSTGNYRLYSKTGWARKIGWNVGFVETKEAIWVFAMNMDMDDIDMARARISITYEILRKEGVIE